MASSVEDQQLQQEEAESVKDVQAHYLRCPSPSFSMMSDRFSTVSDRFSVISGSEAESIFMEPIHLSSAIAAKKIISEELPSRPARPPSPPDSALEPAQQLMVADLYSRVQELLDERSLYNTPCVLDIQRALLRDRLEAPLSPVDEVWPNVYIAEKSVAVNKGRLKRLGITHVLNAAHGTGVYTGPLFYSGMNIHYMGIEVDDFPDADISAHFRSCAEFLDDALLTHRGKVLVDSMMGVSRSAVLVAAYLMIFQNMSIMEALLEIRKKRAISPNEGFIKQLRQLNETLMEERDEDDDETLSQCSVIDAHVRLDEQESVFGVKADSIMVEEEEDGGGSVISSVASSAAAAALRAGVQCGSQPPNTQQPADQLSLPGQTREDEDGDVDRMILEWQKRNEKYQSEDWWEAQLLCENEDDGEDKSQPAVRPDDLESVTSEDVRMVKERIGRRPRRAASLAGSTSSCSSYVDLWKQRLQELEEQAAARHRLHDQDTNSETQQKKIEDDVQSILSDSSSMYNFCKKNKENLTPLERWKIKRIQFGWNKKENTENGEQSEAEPMAAPDLEDVNLTAYQTWKLKQQKKHGGEENKEEILQMSRGEDTATARRRQRREEVLERSRRNLQESQSVCGWETESALSSSIPLSAFCAGAFPSASVCGDDSMSVLSGRSSVLSGRSTRSLPPAVPETPVPPAPVLGPNGEQMVNIANIQNWIASVVNDTLQQKQTEMLMGASVTPSRAGSVFSAGRGVDDDKSSVLSGLSALSGLSRSRAESVVSVGAKARSVLSAAGRAESVFSAGGASQLSCGSRKSKITTTSVPLYSLFQDQVNLHKLDTMEKEIKSDMRDKMASYEIKKITEDNKRSTLYKKKKPKEDDEDVDLTKSNGLEELEARTCEKPKPKRDYGRSGILNLPASANNPTSSIDEWLEHVRPPSSKPRVYDGDGGPIRMSRPSYEELQEPSELDFTSRRSSVSVDVDEEEDYSFRFSSRNCADDDLDPELSYSSSRSPSFNGLSESTSFGSRRSYSRYEDEERSSFQNHSMKQKSSVYEDSGRTAGSRRDEEDDEEISAFIAQIKQRARARVAEEMEDDEVLTAWRKQEESKSHDHK
ncbi:serine/threonine/tyrosine-interacting-like protein 2 [Danio aesculapii]|uniref:serine/threonine/tyrosine-interacting-like protein 2 n=1 Tax=Danio aesculapii TaxID=1142201 RepID=UPI0024C01DB5|nr:serine/threonine/tyrosine-interacting-like protein 2 [Danio aesculapii]